MLTINAYLDTAKLKALQGFKTTTRINGDNSYLEYSLPDGIKVTPDKGRWYIFLSDGDEIPELVENIVTDVSVREWLGYYRENGLYKYETAEAEIESSRQSGDNRTAVRIEAGNLVDALELLRRIKIGNIRPTEVFGGPQDGMSRAELEAALAEVNKDYADVERISNSQAEELRRLTNLSSRITDFYNEVEKTWFMTVSKDWTAGRLKNLFPDIIK